jgi:hypothetical protein
MLLSFRKKIWLDDCNALCGLTAATKVDFDTVSYRMKVNFPLRSLTTWLAGTGPLSLRVL